MEWRGVLCTASTAALYSCTVCRRECNYEVRGRERGGAAAARQVTSHQSLQFLLKPCPLACLAVMGSLIFVLQPGRGGQQPPLPCQLPSQHRNLHLSLRLPRPRPPHTDAAGAGRTGWGRPARPPRNKHRHSQADSVRAAGAEADRGGGGGWWVGVSWCSGGERVGSEAGAGNCPRRPGSALPQPRPAGRRHTLPGRARAGRHTAGGAKQTRSISECGARRPRWAGSRPWRRTAPLPAERPATHTALGLNRHAART